VDVSSRMLLGHDPPHTFYSSNPSDHGDGELLNLPVSWRIASLL
jgi:hypothetical protein